MNASDTPLRPSVLIVGGDADPNITALLAAAARSGVSYQQLLVGKSSHPSLTWDIGSGKLMLEDESLECYAAFVRHDVFTALDDGKPSSHYRAMGWHTAVTGWLAANPEVFVFNRRNLNQVTNKPLVLKLAQDCGLAIPQTLITNDRERLAAFRSGVVKPINGGGYCEPLAEVLERTSVKDGRMAAPAIVQQRLVPPEVRLYVVGDRYFAFNMISPELDYRSTQNCRVEPTEVPGQLIAGFAALLARLGLDFAAADFKTCPDTGELLFLEINNGPMFAAFDLAASGELCLTMIETLMKGSDRAAASANR
jgi:glutathione synthase/RimK-type ligase-like ATP-grasp enzyme